MTISHRATQRSNLEASSSDDSSRDGSSSSNCPCKALSFEQFLEQTILECQEKHEKYERQRRRRSLTGLLVFSIVLVALVFFSSSLQSTLNNSKMNKHLRTSSSFQEKLINKDEQSNEQQFRTKRR